MFHVALFEPEIPPNTGNIIRLCANTGSDLHLIKPLGFTLEDRLLKRAGLDYHEFANISTHENYHDFETAIVDFRVFALSTRGSASVFATQFKPGDTFLFGPETRGLPNYLLDTFDRERICRLPMIESSRSLNLSNAVAVVVYEAWRQCGLERGA
jgi:tRNA (cytidine/uridine-2'-O-)-methyltransferase